MLGRKTNADGTLSWVTMGSRPISPMRAHWNRGSSRNLDVADMEVYTTSDPGTGLGAVGCGDPMGNVTYRSKDVSVTRVSRFYTADSEANAPIETATEAVERANAYYNWGLPFPPAMR